MNLALTPTQRKRADELIIATVKDGADATAQLLRHFPADAWPALIAYLARVAAAGRMSTTQRSNLTATRERVSRSTEGLSDNHARFLALLLAEPLARAAASVDATDMEST
jgi:hypothetical protein